MREAGGQINAYYHSHQLITAHLKPMSTSTKLPAENRRAIIRQRKHHKASRRNIKLDGVCGKKIFGGSQKLLG